MLNISKRHHTYHFTFRLEGEFVYDFIVAQSRSEAIETLRFRHGDEKVSDIRLVDPDTITLNELTNEKI